MNINIDASILNMRKKLSQAPWATLLPSVGIQTLACRPVDVTSVGVQTLVLYMNPVPVFPDTGLPQPLSEAGGQASTRSN